MGIGIRLGLTGQRVNASPASLFTVSGSRGFMYDLSDYSTQFQDTAGTVPITSTAQSVARADDLSGLGNHATQATAGSRPLTTTIGSGFRGIQFDGVDDWLQTAAIDFSNSDEVTVVAGVRKLSDAFVGVLLDLTNSYDANNGAFSIMAPVVDGNAGFCFLSKGTLSSGPNVTGFAAPVSGVLSMRAKISADSVAPRINAIDRGFAGADQGTGNYSNAPVFIGRRGGTAAPFNGVITFLFAINRRLTLNELASVEAYANARTGAF